MASYLQFFLYFWLPYSISLSHMPKHPFHLVSPSPWPLFAAISAFLIVCGLVLSWSSRGTWLLVLGVILLFITCLKWWTNVILESFYQGCHTKRVQSGLRLGIVLFIASEVFFFLGFFWAYLHCALSPNIEIGSSWPPLGLQSLSAFTIPLLNTVILLCSGATVTWSHACLKDGLFLSCFFSLSTTVLLGLFFTLLQGYEYHSCSFCISDGAYGACFFLATGFHGLHVLIGTCFLAINLMRLLGLHFTPARHLGFEFSCWYWHFVDVVWILLYLIVYIWGA